MRRVWVDPAGRRYRKKEDLMSVPESHLHGLHSEPVDASFKKVQDMIKSCIQCGTCTGSCQNSFAMDVTPRHLWRMVLMGKTETVFASKTFAMCSACYYCTLRCPRGLPLTEAMAALKQIASRQDSISFRQSGRFYKSFLESVRRHGRVREMEMMNLYFMAMKNPFLPLQYSGLGLRLIRKGKVPIRLPSKGTGALDALFRKVDELENPSGHSEVS
jgi:heterodisulfide reductase subunit C